MGAQVNLGQPPSGSATDDVRTGLGRLRSAIQDASAIQEIDAALDALSTSVQQISAENAGMADELICLYEQIGVIFDVTRKLPEVGQESQILDLFLKSLRRSFEHRSVHFARRAGQANLWRLEDAGLPLDIWLETALSKCASRGKIIVEARPPSAPTAESPQEFMLAPIFSGDELVGILVLAREGGAVAYRAGEMLLLESLTTFCGDLIRNHRLVRELRLMSVAMVRSLVNAVDQKDEYTSGHSLRVAYYATMLGESLKLAEGDLRMLQWSALLHDVGKIGIRDSVLKKEGKLTDEEFAHIKEHPVRSYRVVQGIPQLAGALDGILYHHERCDGRGYPKGLSGESIPLQARIIQIADVFDALTSNRAYRRAYGPDAALDIMDKEAGTALDPVLERTFAALIRAELAAGPDAWQQLIKRAIEPTLIVGLEHMEGSEV